MNRFCLLCLFLFGVNFYLVAQTDTAPAQPTSAANGLPLNEVGINMTSFVENILSFNGVEEGNNPYLLTYKRYFNGFWVLRTGIGGNYRQTTEESDGTPGTSENSELDFAFRLGAERQYFLNPRWMAYFGFDAVLWAESIRAENDDDFDKVVTSTESLTFGPSPVIGIQFNITPRLNISTESSFSLFYRINNRKVTSESFPEQFNRDDTIEEFEVASVLPIAIFMKFRF